MTTPKNRATTFRIDSHERLSSGFLRVDGRLTKTGVFDYKFGSETVREIRTDSEVFRPESIASLFGAPVTVDHPSGGIVTPENAHLIVGAVTNAQEARPYIEGTLQITDAKAIAMVEAGALVEVSLGYETDPVEYDNDAIADISQTNIIYNHAALGPSGWARLGSDVALRLDSNGDIDYTTFRIDALAEAVVPDSPLDPRWGEVVENLTEILKNL